MRVSCEEGDAGYVTFILERGRMPQKVYLDGVLIHDAITADDELGVVIRYKRDRDDNLILDGDGAARETLHGRVEIE